MKKKTSKKPLILILLVSSLFLIKDKEVSDELYIFPIEYNYHLLEGFLEPEIVDFIPYSHDEIERHSDRLKWASKAFYNEASKRGVDIEHPLLKYYFTMRAPNVNGIKNLSGYCFKPDKVYLKLDFHESTFFHELGHCEFNYSHPYDGTYLIKGYSSNIMHWGFRESEYVFNKKEVLDYFFNYKNHHHINSFVGQLNHLWMVVDIEIKRDTNKVKKN